MSRICQTHGRADRRLGAVLPLLICSGCAALFPAQQPSVFQNPVGPEVETFRQPAVPRGGETPLDVDTYKQEPIELPLDEDDGGAADDSRDEGPTIVPMDVTVPARLTLDVDAPKSSAVGQPVTFRLTIKNTGDEIAENVTVDSAFDNALVFPGSDKKRAIQTFGSLTPEKPEEVALTLVSNTPGTHCCRFSVTMDGQEAVWKSVCVEFEAD